MASYVFKKQPSPDVTKRYSVEVSREGRGLGRKKQLSSADMSKPTYTTDDYNYPTGTDTRAPIGPNDAK